MQFTTIVKFAFVAMLSILSSFGALAAPAVGYHDHIGAEHSFFGSHSRSVKASATSTNSATATTSTSVSSSTSELFSGGQGTYFYPGLGACGWTNSNSDYIVAMSASRYTSSVCGKMVSIAANGKTHTAEVVDECPGCSANSLDMSPTLFSYFADESVGVISIEWEYV